MDTIARVEAVTAKMLSTLLLELAAAHLGNRRGVLAHGGSLGTSLALLGAVLLDANTLHAIEPAHVSSEFPSLER